ncbi:DUF3558 domain-containing protein [Mycobacterium sp. CBMA271]|uniref:DUF3558 domain-containing protein n=1 Tax=unclassified Mycobacteroides TaxID=2618759 RepID=UPI0012DD7F2B|nr:MULTISPECIES: DUF3558 domain-containing protein [unclassified Mycobacteroides]MUM18269.1 hypothetical protein [Mycobacteroides sp. CBMA 326]MUM20856.1 DUF3558 domain-containing protein [Mycobacteroides sp. CBMA 271]
MKRIVVGLAAVAVLLVGPTGCARAVDGTAVTPGESLNASERGENSKLDPYGFANGQCGPLDEKTIVETVKAAQIYQNFFGALCYWVAADDAGNLIDLLYAYYEGGDVDRDRTAAAGMGQKTDDITINGRKGFTSTGPGGAGCGVTVPAGTGSLTWWVQYRKGGDSCAAARQLVEHIVQTVL